MYRPDSLIPRFFQTLIAGTAIAMPMAPPSQAHSQASAERRRADSAHQAPVQQAASDNEAGRGIVEDDARKLAEQNKAVRRNERNKQEQQERKQEAEIDQALADTFPASDAIDRSAGL